MLPFFYIMDTSEHFRLNDKEFGGKVELNKMNLTAMLGIEHPIIQAPMAGVTTPEFVAASAEAGILG